MIARCVAAILWGNFDFIATSAHLRQYFAIIFEFKMTARCVAESFWGYFAFLKCYTINVVVALAKSGADPFRRLARWGAAFEITICQNSSMANNKN